MKLGQVANLLYYFLKKLKTEIERSNPMKKILTACFVFVFLLAVVAGCPNKPVEKKSDSGGSTAVEFGGDDGDTGSMTSSDDFTE